MECKSTLLEHLVGKTPNTDSVSSMVNDEYTKQPKEIRLLAWKLLVESFNTKYGNLSDKQRYILKEYINSIDNSEKLKTFVIKESNSLKKALNSINVTDKIIKIKLNEIIKLTSKLKSAKTITESQILSLLRYNELHDELKRVFK